MASKYPYVLVPTISLAALESPVFQIYINSGKNWIPRDCQNNRQTDIASNYLDMHVPTI